MRINKKIISMFLIVFYIIMLCPNLSSKVYAATIIRTISGFATPNGVAVDNSGNIYVILLHLLIAHSV